MISCSAAVFRRLGATLVGATLVFVPVSAAQASPETLNRSVANLFYAPLDMALAPLTAADALAQNIGDSEDSTAVRVAYAVPGYAWLAGLNFAAGALRGIAGALEFLPGIALYPFQADLDALYDPASRGRALVDIENPLADSQILRFFPLVSSDPRFGIDYTSID